MNSFSKTFTRFSSWTGTVAILAAIFSSGCSSMDKPASASFASVVIVNRTPDKIRQATIAVFQDNGYQMIPAVQMIRWFLNGTPHSAKRLTTPDLPARTKVKRLTSACGRRFGSKIRVLIGWNAKPTP